MNLSFNLDPELPFNADTESEISSAASSRCSSPTIEHPRNLETTLKVVDSPSALTSIDVAVNRTVITPTSVMIYFSTRTASASSRQSLLAQYSHQELVLLEFLTHASDANARDIDEVLIRYPPGFTNACRCANVDEDIGSCEELCEVCQLADAYMNYSFERYKGAAEMIS